MTTLNKKRRSQTKNWKKNQCGGSYNYEFGNRDWGWQDKDEFVEVKAKQNKYSKARPNWVMKKPAPMGYHEKEDLEEKKSYRRRWFWRWKPDREGEPGGPQKQENKPGLTKNIEPEVREGRVERSETEQTESVLENHQIFSGFSTEIEKGKQNLMDK